MRPRFLSTFVCFIAMLNLAPAQSNFSKFEEARLRSVLKTLKVSAIQLDGNVLKPDAKIQAKASLVSNSKTEMEVPESNDGLHGGGRIMGTGTWYVRPAKRILRHYFVNGVENYGEQSGPSLVIRMHKVVPGENGSFLTLIDGESRDTPIAHTLDLKELDLEPGDYQLSFVFRGLSTFTIAESVNFTVENPGYVKTGSVTTKELPKKDAASKKNSQQAAKSFYSLFNFGKIELAAERNRLGERISARCVIVFKENVRTAIPASIREDHRPNSLARAEWYVQKKGGTRFHVGSSDFRSQDKDEIFPMEVFECTVAIETDNYRLTTGT